MCVQCVVQCAIHCVILAASPGRVPRPTAAVLSYLNALKLPATDEADAAEEAAAEEKERAADVTRRRQQNGHVGKRPAPPPRQQQVSLLVCAALPASLPRCESLCKLFARSAVRISFFVSLQRPRV